MILSIMPTGFTGGLGIHYGAERLGLCTPSPEGIPRGRDHDHVTTAHCTTCTPSYALYSEPVEEMGLDPKKDR